MLLIIVFYQAIVTSCWIAPHALNTMEMPSVGLAMENFSDPKAMDLQGDPLVYLWTQGTLTSPLAGDESLL